jgi:putative FmdB family regulatory protein
MPLFEYVCKGCSLKFEQLVSASMEPACPSCHGRDLEKQLSVFAVGGRSSAASRDAAGFEEAAPGGPGACGTCGDPRGPGSCAQG